MLSFCERAFNANCMTVYKIQQLGIAEQHFMRLHLLVSTTSHRFWVYQSRESNCHACTRFYGLSH